MLLEATLLLIIAHIYNAPNTLFLGATDIINPVIGFRLNRNTMYAHFPLPREHSSRSPFCKRRLLIQPHLLSHPTRYPFKTWVENGKRTSMSCQRALVPCPGSNHNLRISSQVLKSLDYDTSTASFSLNLYEVQFLGHGSQCEELRGQAYQLAPGFRRRYEFERSVRGVVCQLGSFELVS